MDRVSIVYETVKKLCDEQSKKRGFISGVTTIEIARILQLHRANVSRDLNKLVRDRKLEKIKGKPVLYKTVQGNETQHGIQNEIEPSIFNCIIGAEGSLKTAIQQAKAAVLYPPDGLHTLIIGDTGTGKSMFAEMMFSYAKEKGRLKSNAPFVSFNCADYANNPQLLVSQLFGVKKGTYTGIEQDKIGLVGRANNGILFLDEIHRLPPEGQEMFFYLIDKGMYRSLGEVDAYHKAKVLIICATTENIQSVLLKTFLRRIPMIIKLPSLKEKPFDERLDLIKHFYRQEAKLLKAPISVTANSLKALLFYDCPGNIGQLKSDIKLTCARAFLEYIHGKDEILSIDSKHLPEHIRQNFIRYKGYRQILDEAGLDDKSLVFTADSSEAVYGVRHEDSFNIYEALEQKINMLKTKGLSEKDISMVVSLEIETYIKRYIGYVDRFNKENITQLYKIVDKRLVDITHLFLNYASRQLKRKFTDKILYGLSIHLSIAVERLKKGKKIFNPHLEEIKRFNPVEFETSKMIAKAVYQDFGINIPEDELGFVTMFLVIEDYERTKSPGRVGVIVAMHGDSTATSMVNVVNRLLREQCAVAYDMPLDQDPEIALKNLTDLVRKTDDGQGIILLVDMGSLTFFGDIIYEKTGIPIKTVEMACTPMVLEAARKAQMLSSLEEIYDSVINLSPYIGKIYHDSGHFDSGIKNDVIITACITGKGTALKLKKIIENYLRKINVEADVIPIDITTIENYNNKIQMIKDEKNIIAVISSIKPSDGSLNHISPVEILEGRGLNSIEDAVMKDSNLELLSRMKTPIKENVDIDFEKFIKGFTSFYLELKSNGVILNQDTFAGLTIHIACAIEKILNGNFQDNRDRQEDAYLFKIYDYHYRIIKKALNEIERGFNIKLPPSEYSNIIKLIHFI